MIEMVLCKHCGMAVEWTGTAMAYGPNPGDCDGWWCELCYRLLSTLNRLCDTGQMPEWPMRYGPTMEIYPWWEAAS